MRFADRIDAGRQLAKKLSKFASRSDVALFALPRGGVQTAAPISEALRLPLSVIVTRKIGAPENEEYALGAMAETGEVLWNEPDRAKDKSVLAVIAKENVEAQRRIQTYRGGKPLPDLTGKTALIVDDGIATGATIRAAIAAARHQHASRIVLAVPHGARDSLAALRKEADEVIALLEPGFYGSVGAFYETFPQVEDEEVIEILKAHAG